MKLYAIVATNLNDVRAFAMRAETPAAAVRAVIDQAPLRSFQRIDVHPLAEIAIAEDGVAEAKS